MSCLDVVMSSVETTLHRQHPDNSLKSESEAIEKFMESSTTMLRFLARRIADIKFEIEISFKDLEILGSMIDDLTFGNIDNTPVED